MSMKVWKDKQGNKLTPKEFGSRFKEGISLITPIQKIKNESRATFIMLVGYVVGLVSLIIYRKLFVVQWFTWGLIIIFVGATWSYLFKWIALIQQVKLFKKMDMDSIDLNSLFKETKEEKGGNK